MMGRTTALFTVAIIVASLAQYSSARVCAGCPVEKDVNDPMVQSYLRKTITGFKALPQGANEQIDLVRVTKASTQVVAGVKYVYEFEAQGVKSGNEYVCRLVMIEHPWLAPKESVLDYSCRVTRSKRSLVGDEVEGHKFCAGCVTEGNTEDATVVQALQRTLFNLNRSQSSNVLSLNKINKVYQQVVAGMRYIIEFEADDSSSTQVCIADIVLQPWISEEPSVTKFTCKPVTH